MTTANDTSAGLSSAGARLRARIRSGEPLLAPGVPDPMTARVAAEFGFPNVYISGAATSALHGYPDMGLIDLADLVRTVRTIASAAEVAPIVDLDTGFGGPLMIRRAMREMEAAGAAGVHIEDQPHERRCGYLSDRPCVPIPKMLERLGAAQAADTGLVLMARTDTLLVSGVDDAVRRSQAYAEAGAEVVKVNGIRTLAELQHIAEAVDVPILYNVSGSDRSPRVTLEQARRLGVAVIIYPIHASRAAVWGARQVLSALAHDEDVSSVSMESFESWMELAGWSEAAAFERRVTAREVE